MTTENTLIQHLIGSIEIALFMDKGVKRFEVKPHSLARSFAIPLCLLPLSLITVLYAHPSENLTTGSIQALSFIYVLRLALYLSAFIGFVYLMAKTMDKMEEFKRFIIANNWIGVPAALLTLIPVSLFLGGFYSWAEIYPVMIFATLYSCACTGFMASKVLRIPTELAAFIAITGMMINYNALDFVKWAAIETLSFIA